MVLQTLMVTIYNQVSLQTSAKSTRQSGLYLYLHSQVFLLFFDFCFLAILHDYNMRAGHTVSLAYELAHAARMLCPPPHTSLEIKSGITSSAFTRLLKVSFIIGSTDILYIYSHHYFYFNI